MMLFLRLRERNIILLAFAVAILFFCSRQIEFSERHGVLSRYISLVTNEIGVGNFEFWRQNFGSRGFRFDDVSTFT